MKLFLLAVVVLVGMCSCEPPRFRSSRLRSRVLSRQEVPPADPAAAAAPAAPYPPSGWKPDGMTLELPTEQTEAPVAEYGPPITEAPAPTNEYGPPANDYGPPTTAPEALPEEEPQAEPVIPLGGGEQSGRLRSAYLLLVPPSSLQRIQIAPQRAPPKLRRANF